MKSFFGCLFLVLVSVLPLEGQTRDVGARAESGRVIVTIPIGQTGVRNDAFLSRGNPPDLSKLGPAESVIVRFQNVTSTDDFDITIGAETFPLRQGGRLDLPLTNLLLAFGPGDIGFFTVRTPNRTLIDETGYFTGPGLAAAPAPTASELGQVIASDERSQRSSSSLRSRRNPGGAAGVTGQRRVVRITLDGVGVDSWEFRNLRNPPYLLASGDANADVLTKQFLDHLDTVEQAAQPDLQRRIREARELIDKELATARALYEKQVLQDNKARPPQNPWERLALLFATDIEFNNLSVERTYVINTDIPTPAAIADAKTSFDRDAARASFEAESGLMLGDCVSGPPATCRVVLNLPNGRPDVVRAAYLAGTNATRELDFLTWYANLNKAQPAVAFNVAFFDENATPSEPTAYVSLVPLSSLKEATSKTTWTLSPTLSFSREPFIAKGQSFSPTADGRYQGVVKRHFVSNLKLVLKQTLGSRADATVEFVVKNDSFGVENEAAVPVVDNQVIDKRVRISTALYQVNISSITGARVSFGKFAFLSPANSIAVREVGEGVRFSAFNRFALSHLVKREGANQVADGDDDDHRVYLVEANNLSGTRWDVVRGINVIGLFGHDKKDGSAQRYWTSGVDFSYALSNLPVSGVAAVYYSDRKSTGTASTVTRGTGTVGYATGTYSWFQPRESDAQPLKVARSVRVEWGRGSTDRLETDSDEAYIGETSTFMPDAIFLTTFASKFAGDVSSRTKSLRHKQYLAAVFQEERFTPLQWLSYWIPEEDIASKVFRAGVRWYHFNDKIVADNDSRSGGTEWFLSSEIETPAGVKSSVVASWYRPGAATRSFFKDGTVWSLVSKITVSLGS